jgi:hypothetical protein
LARCDDHAVVGFLPIRELEFPSAGPGGPVERDNFSTVHVLTSSMEMSDRKIGIGRKAGKNKKRDTESHQATALGSAGYWRVSLPVVLLEDSGEWQAERLRCCGTFVHFSLRAAGIALLVSKLIAFVMRRPMCRHRGSCRQIRNPLWHQLEQLALASRRVG